MIFTASYTSPVGELLLAESDGRLIGLWIKGQKYYLSSIKEKMEMRPDSETLLQTGRWLDQYFAGANPALSQLPLAPIGSVFRKRVWNLLCQIPYGAVTTYGAISQVIAGQMGLAHMSAQAVGGAVAHNPISIIIPCHRVVGTNGSLTGYAGGLEKKKWLLTHEGALHRDTLLPKQFVTPPSDKIHF